MPCRPPPPRNSRSPMPLPLRHQSHPPSSKSDKIRPNLSENGDGTTTDLNHVFRLHSHSHPQNRTETGQKCLKTGRNGNRFPSAPSPSPKSDGISPIPSENEAKLPRIRKTKYHSFALFRLSSHPGFTRPTTWLTYGGFGQLRNAKWLIYGSQIAISRVRGAEPQRSYS